MAVDDGQGHETSELWTTASCEISGEWNQQRFLVSKDRATRMVSSHVVPLKGAVIDWVIQQCARDLERLGTLWAGNIEVRSGTSNRGCLERNRESSWVSWNVVTAFASCRFSAETGSLSAESGQLRREYFFLIFRVESGVPISVHFSGVPVVLLYMQRTSGNQCHVASDGKICT